MRRRATRYLERLCWTAAVLCLLPYALTTGARAWYASLATSDTAVAVAESEAPATPPTRGFVPPSVTDAPDIGDTAGQAPWAPQRLKDFLRYKAQAGLPVAAVLRLPRQNRDIPVFAGVNEVSMTLGAGHLEDTSPLDGTGNIALSAHRDGSFRILEDLKHGDPLVLRVAGTDRLFTVSRQFVVEPDAVDVLAATGTTTLTLITCYPIYYVGKAPERYIVQAELVADSPASAAVVATGQTTGIAHYSSLASQMRRNDL